MQFTVPDLGHPKLLGSREQPSCFREPTFMVVHKDILERKKTKGTPKSIFGRSPKWPCSSSDNILRNMLYST